MSYLDDPDHDWNSLDDTGMKSWEEMVAEAGDFPDDAEIIWKGYFGLRERHPDASREVCLNTSLIWAWG
jgi:hypothetical protein